MTDATLTPTVPAPAAADAAHGDPGKSQRPLPHAGMTLAEAFALVAEDCLQQYRRNEATLSFGYDPEAVHQARIGLRRLRSATTLFRTLLAGPETDRLIARVRDLAACLGEARDLDVLIARAPQGALLARLAQARDDAHAAVLARLREGEARILPADLRAWIADGDWRHDPAKADLRAATLAGFAADALDRQRRKVARHGKHLASLDVEGRHRLRKDVKKLRYGCEFLAGLFAAKGRRRKFAAALLDLQASLGALNDRAAAEERLAALGLAGTAEADALLAAWKPKALLKEAARARHALLDIKPFWH